MSPSKKTIYLPSISNDLDLGDSKKTESINLYIMSKTGLRKTIGMSYGQAYVFIREDGVHRLYVRTVSGIKYLYLDDKFIIPIHGSLNNAVYIEPWIILSIKDTPKTSTLLVLEHRRPTYEFRSIKKGFFSKKECLINKICIGMAGEKLYAIADTFNGKNCGKLLISLDRGKGFEYKEYRNDVILSGWNGEWFSYIEINRDYVKQHIIMYNGSVKKYNIPKNLFGEQFLKPYTMFYYNAANEVAGYNNGYEVKIIDLKNKTILWQKIFSGKVYTPNQDMNDNLIILTTGNKFQVISSSDGRIVFEKEYDGAVNTASLSNKYLAVSIGDKIYIYNRVREEFTEYGRYSIPGTIIGLNIYGSDLLMGYITPSNTLRIMHVNLDETLNVSLHDITMISNTATELRIGEYKWDVRLLRKTSPYLDLVKYGDKIALADKGSEPGRYSIEFILHAPGHLPAICDLNVRIEGLRSALKKIRLQYTPVYGEYGVYIPLTIETSAELDELYAVLVSRDNTIYGSTNIVRNIPRGKTTIPLYISWAKNGIHNVELKIVGWSKRNRVYERFNTKIRFERDIPPLYSRIYSDALYIWSPFELGEADISLKSGETTLSMKQSLSRGWNEIEAPERIPDEVIVNLPSNVRCIVRRGKSWIEFLK